jgi:hypothetical protein
LTLDHFLNLCLELTLWVLWSSLRKSNTALSEIFWNIRLSKRWLVHKGRILDSYGNITRLRCSNWWLWAWFCKANFRNFLDSLNLIFGKHLYQYLWNSISGSLIFSDKINNLLKLGLIVKRWKNKLFCELLQLSVFILFSSLYSIIKLFLGEFNFVYLCQTFRYLILTS